MNLYTNSIPRTKFIFVIWWGSDDITQNITCGQFLFTGDGLGEKKNISQTSYKTKMPHLQLISNSNLSVAILALCCFKILRHTFNQTLVKPRYSCTVVSKKVLTLKLIVLDDFQLQRESWMYSGDQVWWSEYICREYLQMNTSVKLKI